MVWHDHLGVTKNCAQSIRHNLTSAQKRARVDSGGKMLKRFNQGRLNHVYQIVTGDEIWISCYEPERKRQLAQWIFPRANPPK